MTGVSWIVLANLLGGVSYVALGWALEGFSPLEAVFWRSAVAAPLVLPFLRGPSLQRSDWARVVGVSLFGYSLPLIVAAEGQRLSSATLAAILVGTEPVCTLLLGCLVLGEPFTGLKGAAMATGLGGAAFITLQGATPGAALSGETWGNLLLALQGVCWALYTVWSKPSMERVGAARFTAWIVLLSLVPIGLAGHPSVAPALGLGPGLSVERALAAPLSSWAAVAFLAVGVSIAGTMAWNEAVRLLTASRIAQFVLLQPVIGVALGLGIEGKPLGPWSLAGALLIFASLYVSTLAERRALEAPSPC